MYGNVADFEEYHEARGRTIPGTWDDVSMEAALLVASEWIDNKYGLLFEGYKTDGFLQEREWPRQAAYTNTFPSYAFASDEIPERVVQATYEAAFREATTPGSLNVDFTPGKYNSVSISGAIAVEYAQNLSAQDIQKQIVIIGQLLAPLLTDTGSFSPLSGSMARV